MEYVVKLLSGQLRPKLEKIRAFDLVADLSEEVQRISARAAARNIRVDTKIDWELDPGCRRRSDGALLTADRMLTRTLIANLADNAVKFSNSGQHVTWSVGVVGRHLRLEFMDHGPGISLSEREKIFQLWHRSDEHRRHADGMGTGLWLCR